MSTLVQQGASEANWVRDGRGAVGVIGKLRREIAAVWQVSLDLTGDKLVRQEAAAGLIEGDLGRRTTNRDWSHGQGPQAGSHPWAFRKCWF
jgi:hypothetical protein